MAESLFEAGEGAAIVQGALEELHANDPKDEEDKGREAQDIGHFRKHGKDPLDEKRHAGDSFESAQGPQRSEGA